MVGRLPKLIRQSIGIATGRAQAVAAAPANGYGVMVAEGRATPRRPMSVGVVRVDP